MNVVITGFEPFDSAEINSSWEVASRVQQQSFHGVDIEAYKLPVSFRRVGGEVRQLIDNKTPDVLIMLGQHSSAGCIEVERVAVNMMDAVGADNDGFSPDEEPVCHKGENAYFSNLPVKALRDAVISSGFPAKVSNSAGLFVCNCAYYNAFVAIKERDLTTKVVFLHVPSISERFPLVKIVAAVSRVIEEIKNTI